jgi:hypothetical protein
LIAVPKSRRIDRETGRLSLVVSAILSYVIFNRRRMMTVRSATVLPVTLVIAVVARAAAAAAIAVRTT